MLVVLAKLGSTEMLGQFALGFAIAAPVFLLTSLSLREVLSTDARDAHAFGDYLALRVIGVFAGLLAIGAVTCVVGYRWETKLVILLVGGVKAIEAVSDVLYGLMQKHERMDLIAGSIVLRGLLSVVALGAGVYLSGSLVWGLVLVSAAWALVLITYDFPRGARLLESNVRPRWIRADLARLAWLSLPLGITAMMISLRATIPRYFVERYRGEQELGVFVAMAYLMIVGGTAVNALGQSASARLATYYAEGDRASARHLLSGLVGVGLVLGAAGVAVAFLWGGEVLTVLYR
ncbi:MAG TPA: lipopolysaccharide biosynthesis protein, partial [Candidatus Eisenbacteria bacterium]|nr:lipopolysaccharide biosynthesis protein [Candidatus Eisenbacteria bacterium]